MPYYDRPIDSYGVQPLTTASSVENMGIGSMLVDIGLGMGLESLSATLLGSQGMFPNSRPVLAFTGLGPTGSGASTYLSTFDRLYRGAVRRAAGTNGEAAKVIRDNTVVGSGHRTRWHQSKEGGQRRDKTVFKGKGLGRFLDSVKGIDEETDSLRSKFMVGKSLQLFARAWLAHDFFAIGYSLTSAAVQGLDTFRYERRAATHQGGGRDLDLGQGFADTRASFTQRQRAMQAIHNSQMNTRAAMGNEATFMHV